VNALPDVSWTHSLESEQAVLGSLMLDNRSYDQVVDLIGEQDFYRDDHRAIFRETRALIEKGRAADTVTVGERLRLSEKRDIPLTYVVSLVANTPSSHNVRRYAEVVRERSIMRSLFSASRRIQELVCDSRGREVKQMLDEAQTLIIAAGESRLPGRTDFVDLKSLLSGILDFVDDQHTKFLRGELGEVTGLSTGFADLDRMTSGLHPGQLVVLAARPSMGKSALSLNIGEHAARTTNKSVLYFSMEMGNREQGLRIIAGNAGVHVHRLISGRVYESEWPRVVGAVGRLNDVPLYFNEAGGVPISELRAMTRRARREHGELALVVVDYLQLMVAESSNESNRAMQLAEISRGLKLLAKELNVPVLALSQLNREVEKRPNKRPVMSDLRDSGAIEQDADVVLFIYRDEVYNAASADRGSAEIIIGKQRNGPIGTIRLTFRADQTRFHNFSKHDDAEATS
jgi:replicative DNA helicase